MVIDSNNNILSTGQGTKSRVDTGNTADKKPAPEQQTQPSAPAGTEVSLSAKAQAMSQLESRINDTADVDSERVATLKKAIAEGSYRIDPERIAERMLEQDTLFR